MVTSDLTVPLLNACRTDLTVWLPAIAAAYCWVRRTSSGYCMSNDMTLSEFTSYDNIISYRVMLFTELDGASTCG